MTTWFYIPTLPRMSGGLAALLQLAESVAALGWPVKLAAHHPYPAEVADSPLEKSGLMGARPRPGDVWLCPEGWPNALVPGLKAGARTVVYVQNWAYLLAELPDGVRLDELPLHYLAVSRPVAWHLRWVLGKESSLLPPALDPALFHPGQQEHWQEERGLRVGWMPRKNKVMTRQIREMVESRRGRLGQPMPEWVEMDGMSRAEVAETLRSCAVYLSTGFPEGLGLPALEALACGCLGVGFSGFGGWDYMRLPGGALPRLPDDLAAALPPLPGNGLWVPDGDVCSAARALDHALNLTTGQSETWRQQAIALRQGGLTCAAAYSPDAQKLHIKNIWESFFPPKDYAS